MALDFYQFLVENNEMLNMPAIKIKKRGTDKHVLYDKKKTRMDRIAGNIYGDERYWRVIMLANPQHSLEFDIPDGSVIRVPFPKKDVEEEIVQQILDKRSK